MKQFLQFCYDYFHTYDITTEVIMVFIVLLIDGIMLFSKPNKSYMYKILKHGFTFGLMTMVSHIVMLGETILMRRNYNMKIFNVSYFIYSTCYVLVLDFIFVYHTQLSYKRRSQRRYITLMAILFAVIWDYLLLKPMFQGKLLIYENGIYTMSVESDSYIMCSLICGLIIAATTIANRKYIARIIFWGSIIFTPLVVLAVVAQKYFHTAYFICATYVLPFVIYFMLFHSNIYNEVTGCQGEVSYKSFLRKNLNEGRDFIQISVYASKLEGRELSSIEHIVYHVGNYLSRAIEKLDPRVRVYSLSDYEYAILCPCRNEETAEILKRKLIEILTTPVNVNGKEISTVMNFLISKRYDCITELEEQLDLLFLYKQKFENYDVNQFIYITEDDAKKYKRYSLIKRNLLDIKNNNSIDDERILLYLQPIYKLEPKGFRTAESLMRMQIAGEMIYPDEFIPVAEFTGCIHALTRIILYKVARQTVLMKQNCDFDALTVNVSTIELTDPNVSEEFMGIIRHAGAKTENIRMEITESTSITDYSVVISNIKRMNKMGISFYLDDFGTGYSNMDRVLSIPFKTIKFDKSLMYRAISDKRTEELFNFLAKFFKQAGLSLVVEGVEDEHQKNFVKAAGFDFIQGYLYSKPLPAQDAIKFFLK